MEPSHTDQQRPLREGDPPRTKQNHWLGLNASRDMPVSRQGSPLTDAERDKTDALVIRSPGPGLPTGDNNSVPQWLHYLPGFYIHNNHIRKASERVVTHFKVWIKFPARAFRENDQRIPANARLLREQKCAYKVRDFII